MTRVGVISDTHGLVRPEALTALDGSDLILHAGDVGDPSVLEALAAIAPVVAVRGNNDRGPWADALAEIELVTVEDVVVYMLHDLNDLDLDPAAARFGLVVAGHSHQPRCERDGGVLWLNPGSAGPRRFTLPIAVATVEIRGAIVDARIIPIP